MRCRRLRWRSRGRKRRAGHRRLLHDLGHLLHDLGETPSLRGVDDVHQYRALPFLRGLFTDEVLDAIKLHVDAKRYLCAAAGYHSSLSADSKRSLLLQGGIFSGRRGRGLHRPARRRGCGAAAPLGRPGEGCGQGHAAAGAFPGAGAARALPQQGTPDREILP
jgi:hypothetical protein